MKNPELTTVEIRREIANIAHTYCVFNNIKMKDFISKVLEEHLKEFNKKKKEKARIKIEMFI